MNLDQFKKLQKKKQLPDMPGVYFFRKGKEILYIGKATSLRSRVRSYFSDDLIQTRGMFICDMVSLATSITHEETTSVLEALILEANLIKQYLPKYNTKEKDNKSFNFVIITEEEYPRVLVIRGRDLEHMKTLGEVKAKYQFGPFMNGSALQEALKIIRKIFPYRDTCIPNSGKPCFNAQLGLCPGVCAGTITKQEYAKHINHIKLFFEGKKTALKKVLSKEMNQYANLLQFEKAQEVKRQLFAIDHIKDVSLIKDEYRTESIANIQSTDSGSLPFRIESYDIAHTSGVNVTGVMVVVEDGLAKKADYRMFKIRGGFGNNDTASLKEIITRRLKHDEWPKPDIMLIDGGKGQYSAAKEALEKAGIVVDTDITLLSIVKDEKHQPKMFLGQKEDVAKKHKKALLLANAEAHRFTLQFHRKLRSKSMFGNAAPKHKKI